MGTLCARWPFRRSSVLNGEPATPDQVRRLNMKWTTMIAGLMLAMSMNTADAGLFSKFCKPKGTSCATNCCEAGPSCAAPCGPSCAAPCGPTCGPTCAAPQCCTPAPTCCAPAPVDCCCPTRCAAPTKRHGMLDWFKKCCRKKSSCAVECCAPSCAPSCGPTCAAPCGPSCGPTCAAPCGPTCAAPGVRCCN